MASSSSIIIPPFLSAGIISRRNLLLSTTIATVSSPSQLPSPDITITDRVFLDFSLCPTYFRSDPSATLSSTTPCSDSTRLGRVVLGLYGRHVPLTVSTFKLMCTSSSTSYKNTPVHKIFPGQFFLAGRQGLRRDTAEVSPLLKGLPRNTDVVNSKSFLLPHARPGLVSLCLSENDDDDETRLDPNYRNVEFLITTGPGPCPQLDNGNIVFGTVLEGLDVVTSIATVPTYKPSENIRQFNDLAEFLGDERAQNARSLWNRPLKTVFISDCGELKSMWEGWSFSVVFMPYMMKGIVDGKTEKNGFLVFAEQIRESPQIKEAESVKFVRQTEPNLFVKTATKNISSLVTKSSCRADIVY